jgi:hypothetical protein
LLLSIGSPVASSSTPIAVLVRCQGRPAASPPKFVTPLENDNERLDAAHGESLMRYRIYDNILDMADVEPDRRAELDEHEGADVLR